MWHISAVGNNSKNLFASIAYKAPVELNICERGG
jgi:hypothetical protein